MTGWMPKFWFGMEPWALWRVLSGAPFRLAPLRIPMFVLGLYLALVNGLLAIITHMVFARRLAAMDRPRAPVFIVGHWRSGTTLLHELMATDPAFAAPNGFQCFVPGHFLLSESTLRPPLQWLLPKSRPMDDVLLDLKRPQEDEYAILNRTGLSNYARFVAPATRAPIDRLDIEHMSTADRRLWSESWVWFLKSVALRAGANTRLLLKSPHHTARIRIIREIFPDAKFVHIARAPEQVIASTQRTWMAMIDAQAIAPARDARDLDAEIATSFDRMYDNYRRDREALGAHELVEIRYEDLVADPHATIAHVYAQLELGDPARWEPHLRARLAETAEYQPRTGGASTPPMPPAITMVGWYRAAFGY